MRALLTLEYPPDVQEHIFGTENVDDLDWHEDVEDGDHSQPLIHLIDR